MISISTIEPAVAIADYVIIAESSDTEMSEVSARSTLIPTLDGGAVLVNCGISEQDRAVIIKANINQDQEEILWDFFNTCPVLLMSATIGFFKINIKKIKTKNGKLTMTIYILEKEN